MMNANVSLDESVTEAMIDRTNKTTKEIFQWIAYSLNIGGYVPHVYEVDANKIEFVLRRIKGNKMLMRWDVQRKLVAIANYLFRVKKQNYWPVRVIEDILEGKNYTYFVIKVEPGQTVEAAHGIDLGAQDLTDQERYEPLAETAEAVVEGTVPSGVQSESGTVAPRSSLAAPRDLPSGIADDSELLDSSDLDLAAVARLAELSRD